MMQNMWPTMAVLALVAGISGCFPYRDWRGLPYRQEYRDPHYVDTNRDPPGRDCWQRGSDWFCRRSTTAHASIFAW
jgi:hypothetical protein